MNTVTTTPEKPQTAVCVTTFKRYNEGNALGEWINPFEYESIEDFNAACKALFSDEEKPELLFSDWNIPQYLEDYITEYGLLADFYEKAESFQNNFFGTFESLEDFGEAVATQRELLENIPSEVAMYFDYEAYGRDLLLNSEFVQFEDDFFYK